MQRLNTSYPFTVKLHLLWSNLLNKKFLSLVSRYPLLVISVIAQMAKFITLFSNLIISAILSKIIVFCFCFRLSRLSTYLHLTKEEERLDFLVVLVLERLCLSWNWLTMLPKLMVGSCWISTFLVMFLLNTYLIIACFLSVRWFLCLCWCRRTHSWG